MDLAAQAWLLLLLLTCLWLEAGSLPDPAGDQLLYYIAATVLYYSYCTVLYCTVLYWLVSDLKQDVSPSPQVTSWPVSEELWHVPPPSPHSQHCSPGQRIIVLFCWKVFLKNSATKTVKGSGKICKYENVILVNLNLFEMEMVWIQDWGLIRSSPTLAALCEQYSNQRGHQH